MPKFPFDKFVYARRNLGTQMKATGEVMAIGQNFEEAILKACRGLEVGVKDLNLPAFEKETDAKIIERVSQCTDQRIFAIYQALKRKLLTVEEIHEITKVDEWFLWKLEKICDRDKDGEMLFPPKSFKMVDTCAGEFDAETPYFYSTTNGENEAEKFLAERHGGGVAGAAAPAEGVATNEVGAGRLPPLRAQSSYSARDQSASDRELNSTTLRFSASVLSKNSATKSRLSTTTLRPSRPTLTQPTVFTLSHLPRSM